MSRVKRIGSEVATLRAEIKSLQATLAKEVRTQALVVETEDGFARVIVAAGRSSGSVSVHARASRRDPTCVDLFVTDDPTGSGPHLGVALTQQGNVVAGFEALPDGGPSLWLGDPEPG